MSLHDMGMSLVSGIIIRFKKQYNLQLLKFQGFLESKSFSRFKIEMSILKVYPSRDKDDLVGDPEGLTLEQDGEGQFVRLKEIQYLFPEAIALQFRHEHGIWESLIPQKNQNQIDVIYISRPNENHIVRYRSTNY